MRDFYLEHPQWFLPTLTSSVFLFFLIVEAAYSKWGRKNYYEFRDTAANLAMYFGYFAINIFWVRSLYEIYAYVHQFSFFKLGVNWWAFRDKKLIFDWIALFFAEDLCFYTFHRCSHKIRLLWASHVNHHSSKRFNYTVALRQTWTPFVAFIFWLPLPLIGFDPLMVLVAELLSLFYQSLLHTQMFRGTGGLIFNTPSHHRVHHGTNSKYIDRNFGGVLIIWDRLFGTFIKEDEPVIFGLSENIETHNPFVIAFHEWRQILKWSKT